MKAFIKPFEALQRSVKMKFNLIFSLRPGLGREGLNGFQLPKIVSDWDKKIAAPIFQKY